MHILYLLLYLGACACFLLGALATRRRVAGVDCLSFICIGLLLFALVPTIQAMVKING